MAKRERLNKLFELQWETNPKTGKPKRVAKYIGKFYALDMARRGDTVAILGKGAEIYQEIKGKRIYYNDAEVVARLTTPQR